MKRLPALKPIKITASAKLYLLVFIMSSFIVGIGVYGIDVMKTMHQNTQTLYADRVFPMEQLTTIRVSYAIGILSSAQQASVHHISYREAAILVQKAKDSIAVNWEEYTLTYLTPEEEQLVMQTSQLISRSMETVEKLRGILNNEDTHALDSIVKNELYPSVNPVLAKINELIDLQVRVGGQVNTESIKIYNTASTRFYILIAGLLVFAIPFSFYIVRNVKDLIKDLRKSNYKIAEIGEKYQSLVENAGDPIFLLNFDLSFNEVNSVACILLGYSPEEFKHMNVTEIFAPGEIENRPLQFKNMKVNEPFMSERKFRRKDGTELEAEVNIMLLEGKGYLAIARDITERKYIEEAVRKSEKKYRNIFENVQDVFYQTSLDGIILDASPSIESHTGFTRNELIGTHVANLYYDPADREKALKSLREKGELKDYELPFKSSDGELLYISLNARIIRNPDGSPSHLDGSFKNITEQKSIEEAIRKSEKKYRNIFENVQDVFYQTSIEGIILDVSPSIKSHTGFTRDELIGTPVTKLYYDPEDRLEVINLLKEKGEFKDYEVRVKSRSGELVYISLDARLLRDENGNPTHLDCAFRNITERKRLEAQLIEHRKQLTLFIEHSPAALAMFDKDMKYIATSRRWVTDYNLGSRQLIGETLYEFFPGTSQEQKDMHQRCLQGAVEKNEEDIFIRHDGSKEWLRWEIHPWHKATGEIGGIIIFSEVITERKRATELFKYQFENSPDIILLVNKYLKIEAINRGLPGGIPVSELIGMDCVSILPSESQHDVRQSIIRCFETSQSQEIEHTLRHDTRVSSRLVPIVTEALVSHVMVFSTNITKRKQAEEKLKQSEARLKEAQTIAQIGNLEIDMINNIHAWSDECYELFGVSVQDVQPSTEALLSFMHPDDFNFVQKRLTEASAALIASAFDFRFIRRDGSMRYGYMEWKYEFTKDQQPIRLYGIIQDTTERKLAEQERDKMISEIIQRNKNFEQFAYIVSHNLRGPVASIMGVGGILRYNLAEADRDKAQQLLFKEVGRLDAIVKEMNNILAARMEITENRELVCFSELVNNIKSSIQNLISKQNVTIVLDFSAIDQLTTIKSYLHSVFYNLISNSIKYAQPSVAAIIDIKSEINGGKIKIYFRDNGRGIDLKQHRENIFGLYKRFHLDVEGKGLGLFMTKTQVEVLGGSIDVKSEPGSGTEFMIELPVQA
jgi:PAS domain S-box-containing protein